MPERFGEALRKRRRETKRTLSDIADVLGVSVVYVSDVERGNRRPLNNDSIIKVAKLAALTNTSAKLLRSEGAIR